MTFAEMMANGMRFSIFSRAKPTLRLSVVPNGELQVGLTVFALSLALSHGEREQIAGNHNNGRISVIRFPLSVGKRTNCRESQHIVEFQSSDSLSP